MFRALTPLKFETLFSSFDCFSTGETEAILALPGKTTLEILLYMPSAKG